MERTGCFKNCHAIGKDLTWMKEIGQGIDNRNRSKTGKFLDNFMTMGTND